MTKHPFHTTMMSVIFLMPFFVLAQTGKKTKQTLPTGGYVNEFKKGLLEPASTDTNQYALDRKKEIKATLSQEMPVKLLEIPNAPANFMLAQQIALSDSLFTLYVKNKADKKKLFNEIFGVYPARPGDVKPGTPFLPGTLARVEMYNYAVNLTTVGIVEVF